jgi:sugar phosphate permease
VFTVGADWAWLAGQVADPTLGLDITAVGLVTSIFPLCYGMSKFISGTLSDVLSPRVMLGGGLLATGIVNCAFGASSNLTLFCLFWAMNGILQVRERAPCTPPPDSAVRGPSRRALGAA